MKAAIYLRVSTKRQEKRGVSLEMQEEMCRQRARQDGFAEVEVFSEGAKSGRKVAKRLRLRELLSRLSEFGAVYFYTISRLGRNNVETWQMLEQLTKAEIAIHSLKEALDLDTVSGRVVAGIQVVIAQGEAEYASERTRDGLAEVVRQGRKLGPPPLGYRPGDVCRDESGKIIRRDPLQVEPDEAAIVRELFARYATGAPLFSLVPWMNDLLPTRRKGKAWQPSIIKCILTNPVYIGKMKSKGKVLPANHVAIIDEQTFATVQQRVEANRNVGPMARNRSLSPVFRCGICGSPVGTYRGTKKRGAFGCTRRTMLPKEERHETAYLKTDLAIALAWRAVEYLLSDDAIADAQRRNHLACNASERRK